MLSVNELTRNKLLLFLLEVVNDQNNYELVDLLTLSKF